MKFKIEFNVLGMYNNLYLSFYNNAINIQPHKFYCSDPIKCTEDKYYMILRALTFMNHVLLPIGQNYRGQFYGSFPQIIAK